MNNFKINRITINKDNIDLFVKKDGRVGSERFNEERDYLENELLNFIKNGDKKYPERYDLTVMTFDHNKKPWFLTDGSHRSEALKRLLTRGDIDGFDVILLPDLLIPIGKPLEEQRTNDELRDMWVQINKQARDMDEMLKEEGLPIWIKKFDVYQESPDKPPMIWVNVRAIDSNGEDMTMLSVPEYQATREQQPS